MGPDEFWRPDGGQVKMIIPALAIAAALAWSCLASGADPPELKPMPKKFKNIQIVSPSPDIPKEIADFSGVWEGIWKSRFGSFYYSTGPGSPSRRGKLIVYEVFNNKVKFLWAIGDNPNSPIRGGWTKKEAEIEDFEGKKIFSHFFSKTGRSVYYYLENGKLIGKMRDLEIEMNRVKEPSF
jgi:hypothetical protein